MRSPLFSAVEIIFAIGMAVVGVLVVRQSIILRNTPVHLDADPRSPQEIAQSLFNDRVMHELEPSGKPTAFVFLNRVLAGHEWIHNADNSPAPEPIEPGSALCWRCRVSANVMDAEDYRKDAVPVHPYKDKDNIREIAIMIYRDDKPGSMEAPVAKFRARIVPETAKWDKKESKPDGAKSPP